MNLNSLPQPVTISADHYKRLMKANENIAAIQTMMQMFQSQCEQRIQRNNAEAGETWREIAKSNGIDVMNIVWAPHASEPNVIIPIQMKLQNG